MDVENKMTSLAINTSDFVQYSDNSIVSKQLIKQEMGTIALFAFDKSQSLSEHTTPFDAFVQLVDGKAEFIIDGKSIVISKDEFIILPANIPHAVNAIEKFKMLIVMIKNK